MRPARRVAALALALGTMALSCASGPPTGGSTHLVPTREGAPRLADLASGHWTVGPKSPLGPIDSPEVVWDGHELLEFGAPLKQQLSRGARFDPRTVTWHAIRNPPEPIGVPGGLEVWTGHDLFVLGRRPQRSWSTAAVAGVYNPASSVWRTTAPLPFSGLSEAAAVWTGRDVLIVGVGLTARRTVEAALYDVVRNRWRSIKLVASNPVEHIELASTSDGVLLWAFWEIRLHTAANVIESQSGIDVYRLSGDHAWRPVSAPWPQGEFVPQPEQAGNMLLLSPAGVWCGDICTGGGPRFGLHGKAVDAATLRVTPLPHGPLDDAPPQFLWSGRVVIAFNANTRITPPKKYVKATTRGFGPSDQVDPGDIAFFDPTPSAWRRGAAAPKQAGSRAVWAGDRLLMLADDGSVLSFTPQRA